MSCWLLLGLLACAASPRWLEGCPLDAQETRAGLPCSPVWGLRGQKLQPTPLLLQPLALQCHVAMGARAGGFRGVMAGAGSPHRPGPDGVRSAGSLPHGWALSAPPWGQRLAIWG